MSNTLGEMLIIDQDADERQGVTGACAYRQGLLMREHVNRGCVLSYRAVKLGR